jgi:hypothetical protein
MKRENLINRLVTRKMNTTGRGKVGCVPCFGLRSATPAGVKK